MSDVCGNDNPNIPGMSCDAPPSEHGDTLCSICRGNHQGKCVNHDWRTNKEGERKMVEATEWNNGGKHG